MIYRKSLPPNVIEMISNIIGDTNEGLTGSEIHRFLVQSRIEDTDPLMTKRRRLYNALVNNQNKLKCSNQILNFIAYVLAPSRFINDTEKFDKLRCSINQQLAFVGYEIKENGQYKKVQVASKISDVAVKVENFKKELETRKIHEEIFKYCKAELLQNNYFHSVLEANKGLFQRIRSLSDINKDGYSLIEEVFSSNPILIINKYETASEKSEHSGFCNILKGLCHMFRNPIAHEPKIEWEILEQDALEILGMISYCHRRLDKAVKNR